MHTGPDAATADISLAATHTGNSRKMGRIGYAAVRVKTMLWLQSCFHVGIDINHVLQ